MGFSIGSCFRVDALTRLPMTQEKMILADKDGQIRPSGRMDRDGGYSVGT